MTLLAQAISPHNVNTARPEKNVNCRKPAGRVNSLDYCFRRCLNSKSRGLFFINEPFFRET